MLPQRSSLSPTVAAAALTVDPLKRKHANRWRRGREAEGGGLLNRYTVKSRIEGSNPSVSATAKLSIPVTWVTVYRRHG